MDNFLFLKRDLLKRVIPNYFAFYRTETARSATVSSGSCSEPFLSSYLTTHELKFLSKIVFTTNPDDIYVIIKSYSVKYLAKSMHFQVTNSNSGTAVDP